MARSFVCVLFLLLFLVSVKLSSGTLFDLEDVIYQILLRKCPYNERLVTFDVTGDNKTRGPRYTLDSYSNASNKMWRPERSDNCPEFLKFASFLRLSLNNHLHLCHEGKAYISEQVEHEDEYMWSVTRGADFTAQAKFSINVPLIYQFSTEFSTTLTTSSGFTRIETRTTGQLIKQDINIPPGATIEAKWYVNEAQVV
ncbi:secreted salivary gland peptide, putative, partial [Ixodes scapularis]